MLQERGHEVRWATSAEAGAHVASMGIPAVPAGLTLAERSAEFGKRFPETFDLPPDQIPDVMFPKMFGTITAPRTLDDLLPFVRDTWTPDLVVNDAAEFAGAVAAAAVGAAHVTHAFGAVVPRQRVEAAGLAVAPLWESVGLEPAPFGGSYDHLYLDIYPPSMQSAALDYIPRRHALQPVQFNSVDDKTGDVAISRGDQPLVYLTFGTIFNEHPTFGIALDALAALPVDLLVTVGPDADPTAFGTQPGNVRIERYLPQTAVLGVADLVVSHCGSGTFLGALTEGLPQLCLPQGADQFLNASNCRTAGAGLVLEPHEISAEAVRGAALAILDDPEYAAAANRISAEIATMPSPADVAAVLERLR